MRKFERISKEQFDKDLGLLFEKHYYNIELPKRATEKSAGYDIRTVIPFTIAPGETFKVPTGIKVSMESDEVFLVFVRSSIGIKQNLILANNVGVIDADYYNNTDNEGHIWIALTNLGNEIREFKAGDRIAQGIFVNYKSIDDDNATGERTGGIGSTN